MRELLKIKNSERVARSGVPHRARSAEGHEDGMGLRSDRTRSGFLLLEVMVSVVLVAGGLLIVTASFSVSKKMLTESRQDFYSALLLREKMFEIEEKGEIDAASLSGRWPDENKEWSLKTSPIADTDLEKIRLEIIYNRNYNNTNEIWTYLKSKKE